MDAPGRVAPHTPGSEAASSGAPATAAEANTPTAPHGNETTGFKLTEIGSDEIRRPSRGLSVGQRRLLQGISMVGDLQRVVDADPVLRRRPVQTDLDRLLDLHLIQATGSVFDFPRERATTGDGRPVDSKSDDSLVDAPANGSSNPSSPGRAATTGREHRTGTQNVNVSERAVPRRAAKSERAPIADAVAPRSGRLKAAGGVAAVAAAAIAVIYAMNSRTGEPPEAASQSAGRVDAAPQRTPPPSAAEPVAQTPTTPRPTVTAPASAAPIPKAETRTTAAPPTLAPAIASAQSTTAPQRSEPTSPSQGTPAKPETASATLLPPSAASPRPAEAAPRPVQATATAAPPAAEPAQAPQVQAALPRTNAVIDASKACAKPNYPAAALRAEQTGVVLLSFLVDVDGSVVESRVERTSGYRLLDDAARRDLSRCKFVPATAGGRPIQSWARLEFEWRIE